MDLKKLEKFIAFMNENNLSELEIEEEQQRIRLKKYEGQKSQVFQDLPPQAAREKKEPEAKKEEAGLQEIKSPMVGTFYRSSSPGAKPFVDLGERIKKGQVICIIEAMKVMNEIKAEKEGEIAEIPTENGQPVEFGQTLFKVKT